MLLTASCLLFSQEKHNKGCGGKLLRIKMESVRMKLRAKGAVFVEVSGELNR